MRATRIDLGGASFLLKYELPDALKAMALENFEAMFSLRPEQKHQIQIKDYEATTHRYQRSYMNTPPIALFESRPESHKYKYRTSYMFSGLDDTKNRDELPAIFQPFYEHMKQSFADCTYNQASVNWYADGTDYIAFHRDCEEFMTGNKHIAIVTFNEVADQCRDLVFKLDHKTPEAVIKQRGLVERLSVPLEHGSVLVIAGDTQTYFRHGIEPVELGCKRISMSFRQFQPGLESVRASGGRPRDA